MRKEKREPTKLERMIDARLMWEVVEAVLAGIEDDAYVNELTELAIAEVSN